MSGFQRKRSDIFCPVRTITAPLAAQQCQVASIFISVHLSCASIVAWSRQDRPIETNAIASSTTVRAVPPHSTWTECLFSGLGHKLPPIIDDEF
jgi:hypothetical protein